MTFNQSIETCLAKYVTFSGRASRSEFWWFWLFCFVVNGLLTWVDRGLFPDFAGSGIFSTLFALGTFLPSLAVQVRRLHDIDRSGWWFLIILVPLVGIIVWLVWAVKEGTLGSNRFGDDPRHGARL